MRWDTSIEADNQQPYSSTADLSEEEQSIFPYAYCIPRYARLDGSYTNAPDVIPEGRYGYISQELSRGDRSFLNPPVITISFNRLKTSNGIFIVFNRLSGDYASQLKIEWFKDEERIREQIYTPDNVEYLCKARVPLFNRMVLTFLKTSRPYRYLWVSLLNNQKMDDAGGLKIVYDDIALGAKEDSLAESKDKDYYVDMKNLNGTVEFPRYAYCLPRYARMDGSYTNVPEELEDMGYVSSSISDGNGIFPDPPTIEFMFGQNYSSVGVTLQFNDQSGDYCSQIRIQWYLGEELLADQEYFPDTDRYFCYGVVDYFNRITVTFLETNKPYRKAFVTDIVWGLIRIFRDDEIEECNCLTEISPISEEVSINTLDYIIRSKSDYAFDFQKKQKQTLYFDEAIMGIFYLADGKRLGTKRYQIETQDAVGILDNNQYMGGIYNNTPVADILADMMGGESFQYFLDEAFSDAVVSGYLPICSKRAALQQIAFAIGAMVDTSYDRQLYLCPSQTEVSGEFRAEEIFLGLTVDHSDIISGVRLYVHNYTETEEQTEIFRGVVDGSVQITFSEPYHDLTVTGGVLKNWGVNYADVTGTGEEVILTGARYHHSTMTMIKENPKITQNKNTAEIQEATLVTSTNAQKVLDRVYDYYSQNESISCRVVVDGQELGSIVNIDTGFNGMKTGCITKMDFHFSRKKITAEVEIR